jgi:hypothetical protein
MDGFEQSVLGSAKATRRQGVVIELAQHAGRLANCGIVAGRDAQALVGHCRTPHPSRLQQHISRGKKNFKVYATDLPG